MSAKLPPVRVRFAPSPTGSTHLGSGRTALYNYLLARQTGGQFILRIEDTDQRRYVPGAEQELIDTLHWLGLDWDEGPDVGGPYGPYRQTGRKETYLEAARELVEKGHAYYCFCTPERLADLREQQKQAKVSTHYDGLCRRLDPEEARRRVQSGEKHVIRFKMPTEGRISMVDELRGEITVENKNLDDYIIVRSDGLAVYHLSAMVDDHHMDISHVFRGAEWLSTFPLHVHIIRALGWKEPKWVHLSLFLKPSGKGKMSKREAANVAQDGYSIYLKDLRDLGYVPEAVVNWIALMGWSYDDRTEFFTMPDLIEKFSIEKLNPSPAAINFTKLDNFNGLHIRNLNPEDLAARLEPFFVKAGYRPDPEVLRQAAPLLQPRIVTLEDAPEMGGFFFKAEIVPTAAELTGKNMTPEASAEALRHATAFLESLPEITHETAEQPLRTLAEEFGLSAGQLFGLLRVAVTGQTVSPPLFESMAVIGRETVLNRLHRGISILTGTVE